MLRITYLQLILTINRFCGIINIMGRKVGFQTESTQHKELKDIAKLWLLGLGVNKVDEEVRFNGGGERGKGSVVADVVGYCGDVIIALECGGCRRDKLVVLSECVNEIYILPYGQLIPFRWSALDNLCQTCGNKI